nr:zinc finger, CCHC-type [Tanacetum cinerariifolium]
MDSILGNNTYVLADLPLGCKPLGCKWIFKIKLKVDVTIEKFKADLTKEFLSSRFSMKEMGEADVILGIRMKHKSNRIAISQSHYIKKVLKIFNYFDCTPVSTPIDTSEKLMPNNVGNLSKNISNPGTQHWQAIQRVLNYLKKTMDYSLTHTDYPLVLKGYTDASWIRNTKDNSYTSDWVFLLGEGAISWASKKQTCITGSTMKSEFVALTATAILSGADNRPPMLEKEMYDSWKNIMELYMLNRQHGRMILESVENDPFIWPSIEENEVNRPKKYLELTPTEAIQADCDIKATNIILQGLPPEVYVLVSNHKVTKELWEGIRLLMQGTSLMKQERESKLYNEFDKFAYKKGKHYRGDDPIDAINHVMSFLSAVVTSRYLNRNNHLRNSSNPRQQATINDGRITLQPVQGREISFASGHMSKHCTKPKRKQDDSWFKEKVLLVQALALGQSLNEEELAFLADPDIPEVALMANLTNYGSDALAEAVEIDCLKQTHSEHLKENESLTQIVTLLKIDFKKEESRNIDREIALEKRIKQLDNIVFKRDQSTQIVHMLTKPQFFYDHTTKQALETLMLSEESRSKMLLKQKDHMMLEKKFNTTPVDYAALNQISQDFEKRFVSQTKLSDKQVFWSQNSMNSPKPTLSSRPTIVEVPKELPRVSMVNMSLKKLKYELAGFDMVFKERTTPTAIMKAREGSNIQQHVLGMK